MSSAPAALPPEEPPSLTSRVWRVFIGAPRRLTDRSLFHRLSLIPFLAWVGLGADGLSSSAYGPEEAFRALGQHAYLAVVLAGLMASTIALISAAYSRIIEEFPHGGGGSVVATKLLGPRAGVVSGCALLVDYVFTITVSIAAAGDALWSFLPLDWQGWKLPVEVLFIAGLTGLNIRGVRESVLTLAPIFVLFLLTHAVLIGAALALRGSELATTGAQWSHDFEHGVALLGVPALLLLLVHAYSLGEAPTPGSKRFRTDSP